jgi:4-hydroxy-2-oxoheptanedioate aldolase
MRANRLRDAMRSRSLAQGAFAFLPGQTADALLQLGYDFVVVERQHATFDLTAINHHATVASLAGASLLVHVASNNSDEIERVLDAGAHGVVVPNITTRAEAERVVAACRYPPIGRRSVGGVQNRWLHGADYERRADDEVLCILQIEHVDALANVEDIASCPGVDAIMCGPMDLARSLNLSGTYSSPTAIEGPLQVALEAIEKSAQVHGVPYVALASDEAALQRALDRGHCIVIIATDMQLLIEGSKSKLKRAADLYSERHATRDADRAQEVAQ